MTLVLAVKGLEIVQRRLVARREQEHFPEVLLGLVALVTTVRRLAVRIVVAIRTWRAKPRSETLPPATPTT
ncbi:MAG: hypothetical protein AAF447_10575, partial [Myxococcota bacterium]